MWALLLRVHLIPSPGCAQGANIREEQGVQEQCLLFTGEGGDSCKQPVCDAGTSPSGHGASAGRALTALAAACCSAGSGDEFGLRSAQAFHSVAHPIAEVPVLCGGAHVQVLGSLLIIIQKHSCDLTRNSVLPQV